MPMLEDLLFQQIALSQKMEKLTQFETNDLILGIANNPGKLTLMNRGEPACCWNFFSCPNPKKCFIS